MKNMRLYWLVATFTVFAVAAAYLVASLVKIFRSGTSLESSLPTLVAILVVFITWMVWRRVYSFIDAYLTRRGK